MLQKTYEFFTKRVGINKELTLMDQGIQQILTLLGSTVLPGRRGRRTEAISRYAHP